MSLSSWTGENLAKALNSSGALTVTPEAESRIRLVPCEAELLDTLLEGQTLMWSPKSFRDLQGCRMLPTLAPRGTKVWDSPVKDGQYDGRFVGNFNWSERLVASRVWNSLMLKVIADQPSQLVAIAVSTPSGARQSALGIYLGPSEDYAFVTPIRDKYPYPWLGGIISLFFAPTMILFGMAGFVVAVMRRDQRTIGLLTLTFSLLIIGYHMLVSTVVEYGENMRFQAEITPVILVAGFLGFTQLVTTKSKRALSMTGR